jgi:Asp-tRNA(Asn)/Glu-tRNA(Gln) amidotransferase A subunit family amidase
MTTCQEATEAYLDKMEANSEEVKFVAEQKKAPKEDAAVKTDRALKKQHRGRNLATERRQKPKTRTR